MKMYLIILLLVGVSATFAMPTGTSRQKPTMKDAVRMLLESSELLQNWGNTVIDTSKTGLNAENVQNLMSSGASARQSFQESIERVSEMMKENRQEGAPASIYKDMAEGAVEMLKEEARLEALTEDDKLALIAGDKLAADIMRLRINMHLFTRSMEILDSTVSKLESLLADNVTDADIVQVLPKLVEEIGSEGTALGIVFKAIGESFEDAAYMMERLVKEETKEKEKTEEKQDTPSRQRRSNPGRLSSGHWTSALLRSNSRAFSLGDWSIDTGSNSGSFLSIEGAMASFKETLDRLSKSLGYSSGGFPSGFSMDVGHGWNLSFDGVGWTYKYKYGNLHLSAGPIIYEGDLGFKLKIVF